jgi:hypothetical protein
VRSYVEIFMSSFSTFELVVFALVVATFTLLAQMNELTR